MGEYRHAMYNFPLITRMMAWAVFLVFSLSARAAQAPGQAQTSAPAGPAGSQAEVEQAVKSILGGGPREQTNAVLALQASAEKGQPLAEYNLAVCYDTGCGVARDEKRAMELYQKSAAHGLAAAQFDLGLSYLKAGQGVGRDPSMGAVWLRKAADQGFAPAQNQLGVCFFLGTGVAQSDEEAFKWFERAATQNLPKGLFNLGNAYLEGRGVARDSAQGLSYLRRAAEKGFPRAQYRLALLLYKGVEVSKDEVEAFEWALRASRRGNVPATRLAEEITALLPLEKADAVRKKVDAQQSR